MKFYLPFSYLVLINPKNLSCPAVIMELRDISCACCDIGTLQHPAKATASAVGPQNE